MKLLINCDFLLIILMTSLKEINSEPEPGPGTIYYRKPTKLVFYKKYPPVLIYPGKEDSDDDAPTHKPYNFEHDSYKPKDVKFFMVNQNFLHQLADITHYNDKFYIKKVEKKPNYDWLSWLFGSNNDKPKYIQRPTSSYFVASKYQTQPVVLHHPYKPLNIVPPQYQHGYQQTHLYSNSDIKPVVEHIEGDIKYDFRTKTHSIDK